MILYFGSGLIPKILKYIFTSSITPFLINVVSNHQRFDYLYPCTPKILRIWRSKLSFKANRKQISLWMWRSVLEVGIMMNTVISSNGENFHMKVLGTVINFVFRRSPTISQTAGALGGAASSLVRVPTEV